MTTHPFGPGVSDADFLAHLNPTRALQSWPDDEHEPGAVNAPEPPPSREEAAATSAEAYRAAWMAQDTTSPTATPRATPHNVEETPRTIITPRPHPTQPTEARTLRPLTGMADVIDELLRDRDALLDRIEAGRDLRLIARSMLLTTAASAASLGVAVGMFRGGVQVLYAGVKLPIVLLATAALCAPVYPALKIALQQEAKPGRDLALLLSSLALAALVTAALAPVLLYAVFSGITYHKLVLLLVAQCAVGGAVGYTLFFKGINRELRRGHRVICLTLLTVMGLVGAQMSWVMRPYVVRPKTEAVPFVRSIEGSFLGAVRGSTRSARGIYHNRPTLGAKRSATQAQVRTIREAKP